MTTTEFLDRFVYGYRELNQAERDAINHFTLIWSFTEDRVLKGRANKATIENAIKALGEHGQLDSGWYRPQLEYFRNRYFYGESSTTHFVGLRFESKDMEAQVLAVLSGTLADPINELTALMFIIFRLRNNLLHGAKWDYGIRDQFDNFTNASEVLMAVLGARFGFGPAAENLRQN